MADTYTFPPEPRDYLTVDKLWTDTIPPRHSGYWARVRVAAVALKSDGCTCEPDIVIDACYEHDVHWRSGRTVYGVPISTWLANRRFRKVIEARFQEHDNRWLRLFATPVGYLVAWGNWCGVSLGACFIPHRST